VLPVCTVQRKAQAHVPVDRAVWARARETVHMYGDTRDRAVWSHISDTLLGHYPLSVILKLKF
jgi:hypothetical protein